MVHRIKLGHKKVIDTYPQLWDKTPAAVSTY